ncbi:MAG: HD domain-containing protein [Candidatus Shapirobacteria bacterium]|nr:HD domain-containing protein [Candidatus Shapirobacteria bacterium]
MSHPESLLTYKNCLASQKIILTKDSPRLSLVARHSPSYNIGLYGQVVSPEEIDQIEIRESKAYRREDQKTQVIFLPENPHIRNRKSHTDEVYDISTVSSEILGLNTKLCQAIALGHDIGHGPAGHLFEKIALEEGVDFRHEIFSAITAVFIERNGSGISLTRPTVEGILSHSQSSEKTFNFALQNEYKIVRYSDKIAYIFADINDLDRLNAFSREDMNFINSRFPGDQRCRVGKCISALVQESAQKGFVSFEESEVAQEFKEVRSMLFGYYQKFDHKVISASLKLAIDCISSIRGLENYDPILITALMTDKEVDELTNKMRQSIFGRINLTDIKDFGITEIINGDFLRGRTYKSLESDLVDIINS